ncbi:MAG: transglutaminase family protein [Thermodesulfobacteriota bacterium]
MGKVLGFKDEVPQGSSWRILVTLLPVLFAFIRAIILHPKQARGIIKQARAAKKKDQTLRPCQRKGPPYSIPVYRTGMNRYLSREKYLRPSRLIESDAPEIIAVANQLGAFQNASKTFAESCFAYIQRNINFTFLSPLKGARQTLITGEGVCFDKANLFVAFCRAGGVPARLRSLSIALNQQLYEGYTGEIPFMKHFYDAVGYLAGHIIAEAFVEGKWQVADVSLDDCYQAYVGLPLSRFGADSEGLWHWEVPGKSYHYEQIPRLFEAAAQISLKYYRGFFLVMQENWQERHQAGRNIIEALGGEEAYDKKIRQTYQAKLPEVSKRLFKLLNEDETGKDPADPIDSLKGPAL